MRPARKDFGFAMITDTFDNITEAVISPEMFYGVHDKFCDICVVTFMDKVLQYVLDNFSCTCISNVSLDRGPVPIYTFNYKGKRIAIFLTSSTSAGAGTCLEEANCLIGATKYIFFGSCGSLSRDITAGKIIVPDRAYRDDGFSYHYCPASDYIEVKNADFLMRELTSMGIPCVKGGTWTTDGLYRETRGNMEKRKAEGCLAVEMEVAGIQAVCDFRGLELYDFLMSGDLLDAPEWDKRILSSKEEHDEQVKCLHIALELALRL